MSGWRRRDVLGLLAMVAAIFAVHLVGAYFTIGPGR